MSFVNCFHLTQILDHGETVLRAIPSTLTCAMLQEHGSEANNKYVKKFIRKHARQNSPANRIKDTIYR